MCRQGAHNCVPFSPTPSAGKGAVLRRGFTLFELLLVLALIAVMGGLMSPLLGGAFTYAKINSAADDIQAVWADARLHAIERGKPVAFRCLIGSADFSTSLYVMAADSGAPVPADDAQATASLTSGKLDRDLTFSEAASASATDTADPGLRASVRDSSEWSPPIIFYPDGQSSDASVSIAHKEGRGIQVTLRGITGISQKGEVGPSGVAVERSGR